MRLTWFSTSATAKILNKRFLRENMLKYDHLALRKLKKQINKYGCLVDLSCDKTVSNKNN